MMTDAPPPSKRPLGFPLSTESLIHFLHPGGDPDFEAPFSDGPHSFAGNDSLFLRFERRPEIAHGSRSAVARVLELPWGRFDHMPEKDGKWVPLDDASAAIWKYGASAIWERTWDRYYLRTTPAVRVGTCAIVPLPLVQLLARLPRCRVWVSNRASDPLFALWNGGLAMIDPLPDFASGLQKENFRILMPRTDSMDGAFRFRPDQPTRRVKDTPRPTPQPGSWPPPEPID